MNPTTSLRSNAIQLARSVAAARGEHLCTTFADSLSGDVARLQVWRRLRRRFPLATPEIIEVLIEEVLTP